MRLDGYSVILCGASGGLGSAIARELAQDGARLTLADRDEKSLSALRESLARPDEHAIVAVGDLTQPAEAERTAHAALAHASRIDALVNTVGAFRMGPAADAAKDWDFLMRVNALAVLTTSAAVLPAMRAQGFGRVVHVAAGAGLKGGADMSVYSASKAAVMRIVESVAAETRGEGITANCVLPGTIDTPQNRAAMPDADTSSWVAPRDIARAIALILSEDAGAVTGAAIPVDLPSRARR